MKPETLESYQERLFAVLTYIQHHLDEPLPLERLAEVACFSPYHFHRIFRGMVGESVHEHVRRLRLERAAMRLKQGAVTVTEIAFEAGYESHEAFTRAFHRLFGIPPSGFRSSLSSTPSGVQLAGSVDLHPTERGGSKMEVRVETVAARQVAFMRHVGPYDKVGDTWGRLYAWAGRRGFFPPRTRFFAVVHDDPEITPPERLRYDACFDVDARFQPQGEVGVQELAGEYAVTVHQGPYDTLGETYARLCGEWAPAQGRELRSAPAWEVYLNDPRRTKPELLRTEIHIPLE